MTADKLQPIIMLDGSQHDNTGIVIYDHRDLTHCICYSNGLVFGSHTTLIILFMSSISYIS